jgi:hypothetical protein
MKTADLNPFFRFVRAMGAARAAFARDFGTIAPFSAAEDVSEGGRLEKAEMAVYEGAYNLGMELSIVMDSDGKQVLRDLSALLDAHQSQAAVRAVRSYEALFSSIEMVLEINAPAYAAAHRDYLKQLKKNREEARRE